MALMTNNITKKADINEWRTVNEEYIGGFVLDSSNSTSFSITSSKVSEKTTAILLRVFARSYSEQSCYYIMKVSVSNSESITSYTAYVPVRK
jgi:hypothetical protein